MFIATERTGVAGGSGGGSGGPYPAGAGPAGERLEMLPPTDPPQGNAGGAGFLRMVVVKKQVTDKVAAVAVQELAGGNTSTSTAGGVGGEWKLHR